MGFMTFRFQDTGKLIRNKYNDDGGDIVKMIDVYGRSWEGEYDGYGRIDGMSYFAVLADMNGYGFDEDKGLDLWFADMEEEQYLNYPKLVTPDYTGGYLDVPRKPEMGGAGEQGYDAFDE